MPAPSPVTTGATGGGGGTGGGAASSTGKTQPPATCAELAAAAEPHIAAAGAPPLIAVRTAQGSACGAGVDVGAASAIDELNSNEPATIAPTTPLTLWIAMFCLRHRGYKAPIVELLVHCGVSCHHFDNEILNAVAPLQHFEASEREGSQLARAAMCAVGTALPPRCSSSQLWNINTAQSLKV